MAATTTTPTAVRALLVHAPELSAASITATSSAGPRADQPRRADTSVATGILAAAGDSDGVLYIDKATGDEKRVRARVVVLAASACESARILRQAGIDKERIYKALSEVRGEARVDSPTALFPIRYEEV